MGLKALFENQKKGKHNYLVHISVVPTGVSLFAILDNQFNGLIS
jgi:hypothetical protein